MSIEKKVIQKIATEIAKEAILKYLANKGEPTTHHVILDKVFPEERRLRSIIGGLETSMGTRVWERLAIKLATKNQFIVKDPKNFLMPEEMPIVISHFLSASFEKRERNDDYTIEMFMKELRDHLSKMDLPKMLFLPMHSGEGLDLWIEKDGIEYAFDIKTVQLNANKGSALNRQMMQWGVYRLLRGENVVFSANVALPYNPYLEKTWWEKNGGRAKPLKPGDGAVVETEFWDILTGVNNSWDFILKGFESLRGNDELIEAKDKLLYL